MEIINFIFKNFWTFIGSFLFVALILEDAILLLDTILNGIAKIIHKEKKGEKNGSNR